MARCVLILCVFTLPVLAAAEPPKVTPEQREFFEKSIRPVLATRCQKCHGPDKQEGELRLDSRSAMIQGGQTGPAIQPGKPEKSELILAINYDPNGYQMPPKGKLSKEQIDAFTKWVKMGAPWPGDGGSSISPGEAGGIDIAERAKHWSFQPVVRPELPKVKNTSWPRTPIDRFILAKLEAAKLPPAKPADRRTWLRRVTFDVTGLPPTKEEIDDFLKDNSPDAHAKVVDRLLASPAYGERWTRHWLDLVRYAETAGHEFDYDLEHAWPYRDYLVRALNANLPYDQLVVEHIAGDLLRNPRRHPVTGINESVIGTGFYWFGQGKHSPVDIRAEECDCIDNQIDVLGKTFLGLTIACTRCHDHKFDPITTNDYYAMSGFLQSSRRQHAFIEPPGPARKIIGELKPIQQSRSRLVAQAVKRWLDSPRNLAGTLRSNFEAARKDVNAPYHPLAVLSNLDDAAQFDAAKKQLLARYAGLKSQSESNEEFSDFSGESLRSWMTTGHGFDERFTAAGFLSSHAEPKLLLPQTANSGVLAGKLQGVLRSPTFPIEKKFIYLRMHREGGRPNPGRATKNGQAHLVVDGFQFIKDPLYGQLTINVKQEDQFRWYRQDVTKFIGRKAYLEFQDEDDGSLIVDRVVFSDGGQPPETPNSLVVKLLGDPKITSPDALIQGYAQLIEEAGKDWVSDSDWPAARARDEVELLNPILAELDLAKLLTPEERTEFDSLNRRLAELNAALPNPQRAIAMTDGSGEDANILIRGNHTKEGELVERRFLEVFSPESDDPPQGSGRLRLARQIADPQNPLTARVLVNRLWHHHFGRGIVLTTDDFGKMGEPPSHPQLLDWLADEFVANDWSIKHIHRLILLSQTYRLASRAEPEHEKTILAVDPDNRLLHRMNVRRLEGEAIRDFVLAVSGRLDRRMEGLSVLPFLTPFMEGRGRPRSGPLDGNGRRSLYINVRRNFLTPMFLAFDYPTPFSTMGRRSVSNVPAQALTMMNNPLIVQQARVWADRVLAEDHEGQEERIKRLYEMAYSRLPTEGELASALDFLKNQGKEYGGPDDPRTWADLCHVLMNVKEFLFVN